MILGIRGKCFDARENSRYVHKSTYVDIDIKERTRKKSTRPSNKSGRVSPRTFHPAFSLALVAVLFPPPFSLAMVTKYLPFLFFLHFASILTVLKFSGGGGGGRVIVLTSIFYILLQPLNAPTANVTSNQVSRGIYSNSRVLSRERNMCAVLN